MASFVHFLSCLTTNMKLYHWTTTSYARHKAADDCVDVIAGHGDRFMEVYIGKYGRGLQPSKKETNMTLMYLKDADVVPFLDDSIKYLMKDVPKMLSKDDVDLMNIRDDMVGALNQTKYLLTLS